MEVEHEYLSDQYEQDIDMKEGDSISTSSNTLMWTIDAFNFATKRGKIIRTVRERYLRDDLHCSLPQCTLCSPSNLPHITFLSSLPREKQYIIPSMDVVLYQMDVLEFSTKKLNVYQTIHPHEEEILADIIILETVWEYVKRHDLAIYNRLRALLQNPDRRFIVFANEHHQDCYIPPTLQQQPMEIRDAKALAKAYQWYTRHLQALQRDINIILLVNDTTDAQRLQKENIPVTLLDTFLAPLEEKWSQLKDLMVLTTTQSKHAIDW